MQRYVLHCMSWVSCNKHRDKGCKDIVRKHLTGGFLCAVLDLSGILCSLLIPFRN